MRPILTLLMMLPAIASGPSRAQGPKSCSVSGRVSFSSKDPSVRLDELVVYVASKKGVKRSAEVPPHQMAQKDRQFVPSQLIIQQHDLVSFPNLDNEQHSVFTRDRAVNIEASTKANPEPVAFRTEGTFRIQCDIHSKMRAHVVVVPVRELATSVKPDGTWRIDNVPEGLRTLKVIEPNGATNMVNVTACGSDTPVEVSLEGNEAPTLRRKDGTRTSYLEYQ